MRRDRDEILRVLVVAVPACYLLLAGWAMANLSYDIWGAVVIAPVLVLASVPLLRRLFQGQPASIVPIALTALVAHMAGSAARYWVAFDAYGGSADAGRYHDVGRLLAQKVRDDPGRFALVIPRPTGTPFIEKLTGLLYTFIGSSRMAGFVVFGWFAFIGLCFYVRAAAIGVRRLSQRRYAVLVLFLPSLVFWPSSIGKEAWMMFTLGIATYGMARLFSGRQFATSVVVTALALAGAACVRPHVAAIWVAGGVVAAIVSSTVRRQSGQPRSVMRIAATILVALIGAFIVGRVAIEYLDPGSSDDAVAVSDRIDNILETTEGRTTQGGSGFAPPSIASPANWPYAVVRTLTRPLLVEVNSFESLIPGVEMTALLVLALFSLDRLRALPKMAATVPFVAFALVVTILFGLAFSSIGNLGILARQRSQILPLLVLPLCLWPLPRRTRPVAAPARRPVAASQGAS